MAKQFTTLNESSFAGGIDARSAESTIAEGYAEDLVNVDVVEGRLRKRKGYQGYAGNLPVRVAQIEYTAEASGNILVTLPDGINLEATTPTPVVIQGRLGSAPGGAQDFVNGTDSVRYYPTWSTRLRKILQTPTDTITIDAAEHAQGTASLLVGFGVSSSATTLDYTTQIPDTISTDTGTLDIAITSSQSPSDITSFIYYQANATVAGSRYGAALTVTGGTATISAATHGLANFNIIYQLYSVSGSTRTLVTPDSLEINSSTGAVTITAADGSYYILLATTDIATKQSTVIPAGSTGTLTFLDVESPWIFSNTYSQSGSTYSSIIPDSVTYNATLGTLVISLVNSSPSSIMVSSYIGYGVTRSNQMVLDAVVSATPAYTDATPQLTIWGLDHTTIYNASLPRPGWVTHVDSYRRPGEQRLIAGLGGVEYAARSYSEIATTHLLPTLYPRLQSRISADVILAPLVSDTGDTPGRSRGYLTADNSATHTAVVSSAVWNAGTGKVVYTLSLPGLAAWSAAGASLPLTIATVQGMLSLVSGYTDQIEIEGMSWDVHNGSFEIADITAVTATSISISVTNPGIDTADYDDTGCAGTAAIYSDIITVQAGITTYAVGDIILSPGAISDSTLLEIIHISGNNLMVTGVEEVLELPAGLLLVAQRTSNVVPLRDNATTPVASVADVVAGDMLAISGIERMVRVLSVDTIAATITLDESLTIQDTIDSSVALQTTARWVPIQAPGGSGDLIPATSPIPFNSGTYADQSYVRSVMVADNLYFTNGADELKKFDGEHIYDAGLPAWQPGFLVTQDTGAASKITQFEPQHAVASVVTSPTTPVPGATTEMKLALGSQSAYKAGDRVYFYTDSGGGGVGTGIYTVSDVRADSGNGYVTLQTGATVINLGTAPHFIQLVSTYTYYYRLNSVDKNQNIVASAVSGASDHIVELATTAGIYHKMVGLPPLGTYDYNTLEVEIYRTKRNTSAPFYKVTTLQIPYDAGKPYLEYTDSAEDATLVDLDATSTLSGSFLGTGWSQPLRAAHITTAANSLVQANLTDYPEIDMQIVQDTSLTPDIFYGKKLLVRRDSTDTGTATDMVNRATYEWVSTSGAQTVTSYATGTGLFTVGITAHGYAPGDWIYLYYSAVAATARPLVYAGLWQVSTIPTADTLTIKLDAPSGTVGPDRAQHATVRTDIPVLLGRTATPDGNMGMLNGNSAALTFEAARKMAMAINASQVAVDTTLSGYTAYTPWLIARAGNEFQAGQLILRQSQYSVAVPELVLPASLTYSTQTLQIFVNQVRRAAAAQIAAETRLYPSRVLISYQNFPEIMDRPAAQQDIDSNSAVDVNSADGQVITGMIPFFGESAFGGSQQSGVVVIFKENSIYLLDIAQKRAGGSALQKLETQGLGCTAPYSIAQTKNGIMFANESGIYCLKRDLTVEYIGRMMDRKWVGRVNREQLALMQGHQYPIGRQYKLALPIGTDTANSEAYVFDHSSATQQQEGAWTRHTQQPATGWANLGQDAYMATSTGRVMSVRRVGDRTDYRDDAAGIPMQILTRAITGGAWGVRKVYASIMSYWRAVSPGSSSTTLNTSTDLRTTTTTTDPFVIASPDPSDGLSDVPAKKVVEIRHALDNRRGSFLQVQIENSAVDEGVELAGIQIRAATLGDAGILEAADT